MSRRFLHFVRSAQQRHQTRVFTTSGGVKAREQRFPTRVELEEALVRGRVELDKSKRILRGVS